MNITTKFARRFVWLFTAVLFAGCASQDRPFQLVSGAAPVYPVQAKAQGIQGEVKVRYDITEQGSVINAVVIQSSLGKIFDQAALDAIKSWKFNPARKNGVAIAQRDLVSTLSFRSEKRTDNEAALPRR